MKLRSFKLTFILLISTSLFSLKAQSTFIPLNDDYYHLIDRLEIKRGKLTEGFQFSNRPFERKAVIELTDSLLNSPLVRLNSTDRSIIRYLRTDSNEWANDLTIPEDSTGHSATRLGASLPEADSKRNKMWKHPADLYSVRNEDVDIHVNFVTDNFVGKETHTESALWYTGRGVEIRGMINQKLGFYTFVADNQGTFPKYVRDYSQQYNFPGEGMTKILRTTGVDFMSARGYITFRPLKSINVQFGHDRNFIGSGYRSLLFSDNGVPNLFVKINTQIGRFQYTNTWHSMINAQSPAFQNGLRHKKFAVTHRLGVNVTDNLNIGLFEAEVFNRDSTNGGFDLDYLNPIIFYRFVESYLGSSDNAVLGFDFRWLVAGKVSLYGQFVLDEFLSKYIFNSSKSWTNKWGIQGGAKYIDAFGVPGLDLQYERNVVRPYVYSHKDGGQNYVAFNQPIAHPLGSNFIENLGIIRYRFSPKLSFYGTAMFAKKGVDLDVRNWGGNILQNYDGRVDDFGIDLLQGFKEKTNYFDLRVSYMLFHNLFLEGRFLNRKQSIESIHREQKTTMTTLGLRFNMPHRQQVF